MIDQAIVERIVEQAQSRLRNRIDYVNLKGAVSTILAIPSQ